MEKFLFIGLGNPGPEYERTRHNLGIQAVRAWVEKISGADTVWQEEGSFNGAEAVVHIGDAEVTCLFPLTYMNKSGQAVGAFLKNHPVETSNILIIHDELELPLGEIKFKAGGSAGGHKGVRSIHEALGTQEIPRLRLGVGRPSDTTPVDEYVLQKFSPEEEAVIQEQTLPAAVATISEYVGLIPAS